MIAIVTFGCHRDVRVIRTSSHTENARMIQVQACTYTFAPTQLCSAAQFLCCPKPFEANVPREEINAAYPVCRALQQSKSRSSFVVPEEHDQVQMPLTYSCAQMPCSRFVDSNQVLMKYIVNEVLIAFNEGNAMPTQI